MTEKMQAYAQRGLYAVRIYRKGTAREVGGKAVNMFFV